MKLLKRCLIGMILCACLVGCFGCSKDRRIYAKDITAVIDGNEQVINYPGERVALPEGGEILLGVDMPGGNYTFKDKAGTITGTSHEVEVTFAGNIRPTFKKEDIRFMAVGTMDKEIRNMPFEDMTFEHGFGAILDTQVEFPVTEFQSKRGKLNFTFEIDKPLPGDVMMFVVAIWYDYNDHNVFIPLLLAPDLLDGEEEMFSEDFDWRAWNPVYEAPGSEPPEID